MAAYSVFVQVLLLLSLFFAGPCTAFLRSTADINPLTGNYTLWGPGPNVTDVIAYSDTNGTVKSYWFACALVGTDGHEYSLIITNANAGTGYIIQGISYTDLTLGTTFGESFLFPGQLSTTEFYASSEIMTMGAYSEDQFSSLYATSNLSSAVFNLTFTPVGMQLYQAGSGNFNWGLKPQLAFDVPQCLVSGTIGSGPNKTEIVTAESSAWLDYQWGPGFLPAGWYNFIAILNNGVSMQITFSNPDPAYRGNAFTTLVFPDGHHELYPVYPDPQPSNPWISERTNISYFQSYNISIPTAGIYFNVTAPVQCGETTTWDNPIPAISLADTFILYEGMFKGYYVEGYGVVERKIGDLASCFGSGC